MGLLGGIWEGLKMLPVIGKIPCAVDFAKSVFRGDLKGAVLNGIGMLTIGGAAYTGLKSLTSFGPKINVLARGMSIMHESEQGQKAQQAQQAQGGGMDVNAEYAALTAGRQPAY